MSDPSNPFQSLTQLATALREGSTTPVRLTEQALERIRRLDGKLGAFRLVCEEQALEQARQAEAAMKNGGALGPLHGIPYAAKDLYDVKGLPTAAGTRLLEDNIAGADSTVVKKLNEAGMILVGKTHTVQFAYGGVGINTDMGTPVNPWHATPHVPGGSSSGSGVAVAAGMVPMALGSDTGGSVRIPSALCGVTGLKTTVGRISRAGVYPLSWSLDSVGPLTRTVEDAVLVYQALVGEDTADATTLNRPPQDVPGALRGGIEGMRLAVPETIFWDDVEPEVANAVRAAIKTLEGLGAKVTSIPFPEAAEAMALNPRGLVIAAEAYTLNRRLVDDHFDQLDPVVAHRIVKGRDIPAHEYLETVRAWEALRVRTVEALREIDALLVPATMIAAKPIAETGADMEVYAQRNLAYLRNTSIGNTLGLCGLSVPCGFNGAGLPIGLMVYGKPFDEAAVVRVGHAFQQATDFHLKFPDLGWAGG